ncbi:MAG: hypothetical protein U0525_06435 [Patescibacteria group bacterium]
MNKETIIAIVLGLTLGLAASVGAVYYTVQKQKMANSQANATEKKATNSAIMVSIPPTVTVLQSLDIEKPLSGIVTQNKNVSVVGKTGKKALLVFQSPIKTIAQETENGDFTVDFPLALGENTITVSAYYANAAMPVQKKIFVYRIIPE